MNNNFKLLDWITIISFLVGIYALYVALENLEENREQEDELKQILNYLDTHLASQDKILENITKGGNYGIRGQSM